jgi:hypothetical protein
VERGGDVVSVQRVRRDDKVVLGHGRTKVQGISPVDLRSDGGGVQIRECIHHLKTSLQTPQTSHRLTNQGP